MNLQKAAQGAMDGYQGTLVMTNPSNGQILAAYGTEGHNPLSASFEPGSVIKVLTYGTWLAEDGDKAKYAPKTWPGNLTIGGKIFYDWTTQGRLETIDQGMAVSCNLMFAQMGNDLGWSRLQSSFVRYFDNKELEGLLLPASHGHLVREPENAWELGRAAIGLDFWATSCLGLVQIPAAVANGGKLVDHQMILRYANVEGRTYRELDAPEVREMMSADQADELLNSMVASIDFSRGTARRAEVPFVKAAMKTGTAGERPFNSIMIGLFPREAPKVAFALYLDKGGKCEINGARVAKRLQEQIKALAPEYLE